MKHGVAFGKFSRTSSHRMLMLRNLVTSLIEHEQIKTTVPKARDTARLAEKMITLGKKGGLPAARRAQGFLLKQTLIPKLFGRLAHRYAHRPGGYTRIHKFGNRHGDNAPYAILELVDNPHDLRFDMTARAVGWELFGDAVAKKKWDVFTDGVNVEEAIRRERSSEKPGFLHEGVGGRLRRITQDNLKKVLRYRPNIGGVKELAEKAEQHIKNIIAEPFSHPQVRRHLGDEADTIKHAEGENVAAAYLENRQKAAPVGRRLPSSDDSALSLSYGALRRRRNPGLGLPGAGWYDRQRAVIKEKQRFKV